MSVMTNGRIRLADLNLAKIAPLPIYAISTNMLSIVVIVINRV